MVAVNLMVLRSPGASEVTVLPLRTTSGSMVRLTVRRGAVPVKVSAALALRDLTTTLPLASTSL